MRYNRLLAAIEKATARYEAEIQRLLQKASKADTTTDEKLLKSVNLALIKPLRRKAKRAYKKKHWTQKPENKARVQQQLKRATAAKKAAKKAAQ